MLKSGKFRNPRQEAINALVVCNDSPHLFGVAFLHIGRGRILFVLVTGSFRNLSVENKQNIGYHASFLYKRIDEVPSIQAKSKDYEKDLFSIVYALAEHCRCTCRNFYFL